MAAPDPSRGAPARVLADGWYSWLAPTDGVPSWTVFSDLVGRLPAPLARWLVACGPLRGLALASASARFGAVAVIRHDPGWRTLLLARALLGRRRKLVVFQFFDHQTRSARGRVLAWIERWALRRALAVAQVLTPAELAAYPDIYGIDPDRFRLVRFAARTAPRGAQLPPARENGPVVAAGRAHCDWRTLFGAASRRGWDLQIVCAAADRPVVERLNAELSVGAQISVELPHSETHALLSRAAISVICVEDGLVGRGHIRLAEATDTGTAVVASDVPALAGYATGGVTAVLVPVGDPTALRQAVERLLRDPGLRAGLAAAAFARAATWTGADYVAALQVLAADGARSNGEGRPAAVPRGGEPGWPTTFRLLRALRWRPGPPAGWRRRRGRR